MREGKIIAAESPAGLKKTFFPTPVYEFDPKEKLSFSDISALERHPSFAFFEPYGLRFHAAVREGAAWDEARGSLEKKFNIRVIPPTLEDVFIRAVEAKS